LPLPSALVASDRSTSDDRTIAERLLDPALVFEDAPHSSAFGRSL
jgi:hypothetical protein